MGQMSSQRIRYLRASDGVRLAWAEAGTGPTVVKAANWLTHLEYEWESPVWRHWMRFFSSHFRGRVAVRPDKPVLAGRSAFADRPGTTSVAAG